MGNKKDPGKPPDKPKPKATAAVEPDGTDMEYEQGNQALKDLFTAVDKIEEESASDLLESESESELESEQKLELELESDLETQPDMMMELELSHGLRE